MFRTYETAVDGDVDALSRVREVIVAHAKEYAGFSGIVAIAGRGVYTREAPRDLFSVAGNDMIARVGTASRGKLDYAYIFAVAPIAHAPNHRQQYVQGAFLCLKSSAQLVHNVCAVFEAKCNEAEEWTVGSAFHLPRARFFGETELMKLALGSETASCPRRREAHLPCQQTGPCTPACGGIDGSPKAPAQSAAYRTITGGP